MPLDDRSGRPSVEPNGYSARAPEDGNSVLLVRAGIALVVVTAALTQYLLGLAAASARAAWSRRGGDH